MHFQGGLSWFDPCMASRAITFNKAARSKELPPMCMGLRPYEDFLNAGFSQAC